MKIPAAVCITRRRDIASQDPARAIEGAALRPGNFRFRGGADGKRRRLMWQTPQIGVTDTEGAEQELKTPRFRTINSTRSLGRVLQRQVWWIGIPPRCSHRGHGEGRGMRQRHEHQRLRFVAMVRPSIVSGCCSREGGAHRNEREATAEHLVF